MYSNIDIHNAIIKKDLIITPFNQDQVKAAGLTLHLGETLLKADTKTVIDIKNNIKPEYEKIIITDDSPYTIQPQEFLLAHTYEKVTVGRNIGFLIEGRSTLARIGLTIVQTAMLVYPGHRNRAVTLEIANHGNNPIILYPKMKIARVALFELKTPSDYDYDDIGKYRNQDSVGEPIFDDEFL